MKELSDVERRAASEVLQTASETFSNNGCNDFYLDNTLDNWSFKLRVERWAGIETEDIGNRPPLDQKIVTYDWMVMRYLAKRLEGKIE